jgi:ribosomal protein S18 acetylase RimI-like enzyme
MQRINPNSGSTLLSLAASTDESYFRLGATCEQIFGARMHWMQGLGRLPGAVTVHCSSSDVAKGGIPFLQQIERRLEDIGAVMARLYMDGVCSPSANVLTGLGYENREEAIFVKRTWVDGRHDLRLRCVSSEADWEQKLGFHQAAVERPDGHAASAHDWVEMERRKCASGKMIAYMAEIGHETVGVCGALDENELRRLKNIVVHPAHRRRGIAGKMIAMVSGQASRRVPACVFAVVGSVGELLYRSLGMHEIGRVTEWSKPLLGHGR